MPEKLYSVKETCALLGGIAEITLWRLRKRGELKARLIGTRPVFYASDIEDFQRRLKDEGCIATEGTRAEAASSSVN